MADEERPSETSREAVRLWRVYRTVREMLDDRGYEQLPEEIAISLEEFKTKFVDTNGQANRSKMGFTLRPTDAMLAKYTDPPTASKPDPQPQIGTIWVEFNGEQTVGVKHLRAFAHMINDNHYYTGIFISAVPVSSGALKIIPTVLPSIIETFQEQDLLVNISRHELVPKHVLLSTEDRNALLQRYRLKMSQLPRIQRDDAMAKFLGLRRGQVVKIIRSSETAGRYASYRAVI